jgi:hypothetical protein
MRNRILPAANHVYQLEAAQLHQRYRSAGAGLDTIGVAVVALIALAVLIGTQLWIAGRTNRLFNVPMALATVLVVAIAGWTLLAFAAAHHSTAQAKSGGSDAVEVLARARSVGLQASIDESLAIVARGNGQSLLADFDNATSQLVSSDNSTGLLVDAARLTAGNSEARAQVDKARTAYGAYLAAHSDVRKTDDGGLSAQVVAQKAITEEYPQFAIFNNGLVKALALMQNQFATKASHARSTLSPLPYAVPLLLILAALLALAGIQQRINDYR